MGVAENDTGETSQAHQNPEAMDTDENNGIEPKANGETSQEQWRQHEDEEDFRQWCKAMGVKECKSNDMEPQTNEDEDEDDEEEDMLLN